MSESAVLRLMTIFMSGPFAMVAGVGTVTVAKRGRRPRQEVRDAA